MQRQVLKALLQLNEDELTEEIIVPLIERLHPGRVEYTHSPIEAGRDLVSFGLDNLHRPSVLCIQVKAVKLSYGAAAFQQVKAAAEFAKIEGVTSASGQKIRPQEVWVVTSHPFGEHFRKQAADVIDDLGKKNIKIVGGEELSDLLINNLPEIVTELVKYSSPEVVGLISELSKHKEGRAFGLSHDRNISDFYVTTALAPPQTNLAFAAIRGMISISNSKIQQKISVEQLLEPSDFVKQAAKFESLLLSRTKLTIKKNTLGGRDIKFGIKIKEKSSEIKENFFKSLRFTENSFLQIHQMAQRLRKKESSVEKRLFNLLSPDAQNLLAGFREDGVDDDRLKKLLARDFNGLINDNSSDLTEQFKQIKFSNLTKSLLEVRDEAQSQAVLNRSLLSDIFPNELDKIGYYQEVSAECEIKLTDSFEDLVNATKKRVKNCPQTLESDASQVKEALIKLGETEQFIRFVHNNISSHLVQNRQTVNEISNDILRVRVPEPEHLLQLNRGILIQGQPGCGKTTLLRTLAVKLLGENQAVRYLACSTVGIDAKKESLLNLVKKFSVGLPTKKDAEYKNYTLILDGLDEAPFDVSAAVLNGFEVFNNIVASTRNAHKTSVRGRFLNINLSPFTDDERNQFFEKWFGNDGQLFDQAQELIAKYPDINHHTRLPLIATIMASLLQHGLVPRTRSEIYEYRLKLLLSNWDKMRGVKRLKIDNPEAKLRFIKLLAYKMHSQESGGRPERKRIVTLPEFLGSVDILIQSNNLTK